MIDYKDALDKWVREATYVLPGSAVADMLEETVTAIRPEGPPRGAAHRAAPGRGSCRCRHHRGGQRRGRPKGSTRPAAPAGEGADADF